MNPYPKQNDFKKAMSSIVLTSGAALTELQKALDGPRVRKKRKMENEVRLTVEFCELLLKPVNDCGPSVSEVEKFAETYCRKHLFAASDFYRRALKTHAAGSPEIRRLAHIAGLIEKSLTKNLNDETVSLCWEGTARPHRNLDNRKVALAQ
jgi:hypothetical protein